MTPDRITSSCSGRSEIKCQGTGVSAPPLNCGVRRHMNGQLHPPSAVAFYRGALSYAHAATELGSLHDPPIELSLKAYLLHVGVPEDRLRRSIGHNLVAAWEQAASRGLSLEAPIPYWVQVLSFAHDAPYLYRYGRQNTATVVPETRQLLQDLNAVVVLVGNAVGLDGGGNAV